MDQHYSAFISYKHAPADSNSSHEEKRGLTFWKKGLDILETPLEWDWKRWDN